MIVFRPGITTQQVLTVLQQHGWKVYRDTNGAHNKKFCVGVGTRDAYLADVVGHDWKARAFVEKVATDDRSVAMEGISC